MALALCGHVKSLLLHEFDEAIATVRPSHLGQPEQRDRLDPEQPHVQLHRQRAGSDPQSRARATAVASRSSRSSSPTPSWASPSTSPARTTKAIRWDGKPGRKIRDTPRTCASSRSTWPPPGIWRRPGRWVGRSSPWSLDSGSTASWRAMPLREPEHRARFAQITSRRRTPGLTAAASRHQGLPFERSSRPPRCISFSRPGI